MKQMDLAEAHAHLPALITAVADGGDPIVIERHGRPLADLVCLDDLTLITRARPAEPRLGALALVGAWGNVDDDVIDALIADIYAQRSQRTSS